MNLKKIKPIRIKETEIKPIRVPAQWGFNFDLFKGEKPKKKR